VRPNSVRGGKPKTNLLIQFTTTGAMEREQSCESFDLLLQTLHQVLLHEETPLSLELGVNNREVIQAVRTHDDHSRRAIKNALRNVYLNVFC
jgi:site-specific DNA-adenine methylase